MSNNHILEEHLNNNLSFLLIKNYKNLPLSQLNVKNKVSIKSHQFIQYFQMKKCKCHQNNNDTDKLYKLSLFFFCII